MTTIDVTKLTTAALFEAVDNAETSLEEILIDILAAVKDGQAELARRRFEAFATLIRRGNVLRLPTDDTELLAVCDALL